MKQVSNNIIELNNATEKELVIEAFLKLVDMHYTNGPDYVGLRGNSQICLRFSPTSVWINTHNEELQQFFCNYVIETSRNALAFK